jgi:hypothetical protein
MKAAICYRQNNEYKTITVDTDGSPAFVGAILYAKFQTERAVEKLFKLGDLYELHETMTPIPNLGHYILKDGTKVQEIRLQEGVCISKYRDIRQIEGSIIKKSKMVRPRVYLNPKMAFICEGADYVYVFDAEKEQWSTWGIDMRSKEFGALKINYHLYIKNLIYREDITDLTATEKNKLSYIN